MTPPAVESLSVVIAAYNRGPRIARTLDSVLSQSWPPSEIIVVDDGSTDDTFAWTQAHYPQVRVVRFDNGGASVARNRGAELASGAWLVFLDSDDEMLPHAIETLVGLRRRFPAARAAFADHTFRNLIDGTYWPNHHFHVPSFARMRAIPAIEDAGGARLYGPAMYYALLRGNILQQPWAIERATFAALGGFDADVRLCEDWEMYLRVCRSVPVAVSDRVIANHFVEPGKCHMSLAEGQADWHMKVLAKHERLTRWRDLRAWSIIQRRRGMYFKAAGDAQRLTNWPAAWRMYLRSWLAWPFDYVVAARCAAWAPAALRGRAASGSSSASGR